MPKHENINGEQLSIEQIQKLSLKVIDVLDGVNVLACKFVLQQAEIMLSDVAYVQSVSSGTLNPHKQDLL